MSKHIKFLPWGFWLIFCSCNFLMIKCDILSFSNYELGNVKKLLNLSSLNYFLQCNLTFIHEIFWLPFYMDRFLIFSELKLELKKPNNLMFFQFWQLWLFNFNQPCKCTQCEQLQTFPRSFFTLLKMMHNVKNICWWRYAKCKWGQMLSLFTKMHLKNASQNDSLSLQIKV
jgi:hypothetical protein